MSLLAAPFSAALSIIFNNANWSLSRVVLALVQGMRSCLAAMFMWSGRIGRAARVRKLPCSMPAPARPFILRARRTRTGSSTRAARAITNGFVRDYLHSRGVDRLDGVVLSHGDSLHIGGSRRLLDEFRPRHVLDNAAPDRSRVHHSLIVRLPNRELLGSWQSAFSRTEDRCPHSLSATRLQSASRRRRSAGRAPGDRRSTFAFSWSLTAV